MPFVRKIWKRELCQFLARLIVRHPFWIIGFAFLLTLASLSILPRLSIDSDYLAFLPDTFPGVQNLRMINKKRGGFGNFMIVLEGANAEIRRTFAKDFVAKVSQYDWVDYAEFEKGWDKIEKNRLLFVSLEDLQVIENRLNQYIKDKKQEKNPLVISLLEEGEAPVAELDFKDIERKYQMTTFGSPYYEDPELKYTIVLIWPKGSMTDIDFAKKAYQDLDHLISKINPAKYHPRLKAGIGGEFRSKIDEYTSLIRNVLGSSLITFLGISLLLIVFYRRIGAVFYTLFPLLLGTLWTFGISALLVGRLNILTVFLAAILFGIGVDYGIYLFSRYREERKIHPSLEEAITSTLFDTGRALISAALTTALAFFTLVLTDFKGFQEFGLLSALGIGILLSAYLFFAPVLWVLAERWGFMRPDKFGEGGFWIPPFPLSRRVVVWGFIFSFLCLLFVPLVSFEYDYGKLRSRKNSYWDLNSKIHAVFPLSKTPALVLTDSLQETVEVVKKVKEIIPRTSTIDTVKSIFDFVPQDTEEKKAVLVSIENLLKKNERHMSSGDRERLKEIEPYLHPTEIKMEDLPQSLKRQFIPDPGSSENLVLIYDKVRLSDTKLARQYSSDIREIATQKQVYHPAEGSMIFADALYLMRRESALAFLIMLFVVYLVLLWDFQNSRRAMIVVTPILIGFILTLGVMALFGVKLNIFNLVVFPILIGIADDSSLHLYHRMVHNAGREPVGKIVRQTGNSIILATLTTMIGFGSFLTADHRGLQSIGVIALIGLACNLAASLIFFPSFVQWILDRKKPV